MRTGLVMEQGETEDIIRMKGNIRRKKCSKMRAKDGRGVPDIKRKQAGRGEEDAGQT